MSGSIADYAIIGDMRTAALVGRDGSIDWWCAPRFDSDPLFARLLGDDGAGFWRLAPRDDARVTRAYAGASLVLETTFETASGAVKLMDGLVLDSDRPVLVRVVEALGGNVALRSCLRPRTRSGEVMPWTRCEPNGWRAVTGTDGLLLRADVPVADERGEAIADFVLEPGRRVTFALHWFAADAAAPPPCDAVGSIGAAIRWWHDWAAALRYDGRWRDAVIRSALTLKALTDRTTGAMVAAATTSLPERQGGDRNWDYRYCWIRDASFGFRSLARVGAHRELSAWAEWFFRVYAGHPESLQIMYGTGGERLSPEEPAPWLDGYRGSRPVRLGNDAHDQLQLGVIGEITTAIVAGVDAGYELDAERWSALRPLLPYLEQVWHLPGNGIWELRGERRHYVHSKAMAWHAARNLAHLAERFDRASAAAATALARDIRADVERNGFDPARGAFVESYGAAALDASVLLLPIRGFSPATDPRIVSTVAAMERELMVDGYVFRYSSDIIRRGRTVRTREGAFAMCGFWLVEVLVAQGRRRDAEELFERLLRTANDLGIMSEEFDVHAGEPVGNTPQALSHAGLIDAALALESGFASELIASGR